MSESLGQQVIVENIGAAAGIVGTDGVAKAAGKVYTFLLGSVGTHAYNATLYKKLPYNTAGDSRCRAVRRAAYGLRDHAQGFSCQQSSRVHQQREGGGGGRTSCNMARPGVRFHDPSRLRTAQRGNRHRYDARSLSQQPAMLDLIAGHSHCMLLEQCPRAPADREQHAKRDRPIGTQPLVATAVPATAHEQGRVDFEAITWNAFFLPKGAPTPIVKKLNDAAIEANKQPAVKPNTELVLDLVAPERRSPEYLQKFVESEVAKWAGPIKAAGVFMDEENRR